MKSMKKKKRKRKKRKGNEERDDEDEKEMSASDCKREEAYDPDARDIFNLNMQSAIAESIRVNAKPLTERQIWSLLLRHEPELFKLRKKIVLDRIDARIRGFGGRTVHVCGDGNCLLNAFCFYRFGDVESADVSRERAAVVEFMVKHRDLFPTVTEPQRYARNGAFLLGEHITAWHLLREVNVVVFTYYADRDGFSRHFWYNEEWKGRRSCTILYTEFGVGHYDFVADIHNTLAPERDYVPAPKGFKCKALKRFDVKHDNYHAMMKLYGKTK